MVSSKIYITGASGRLGRSVLKKIDGIPLVLEPSGLKNEIVTDFSEEQLVEIFKDANVIIHIAGSVETHDRKKLEQGNVELTKKVVRAAPEKSKIIFASSISVYGKELAEKPANEKTKTKPDSDYSRTKLEAENFVAKHKNHVILRIGTLYGSQFSDYQKILSKLKNKKMKIIGDGNNRIPFVHVDDVADVFKNAISSGHGAYVVTGEALTQMEIYRISAKLLNVDPPEQHLAISTAMLMAGISEFWYKLTKKRPSLSKEHVGVLAYDRIFDCSKAEKELKFRPRSLEKGIEQAIKELRGQL